MKPISFWHRLLDLISPRLCVVCGRRLSVTENVICNKCNFHLPRTGFARNAYENEMAKLFWGQLPIERAAAFFYYESQYEDIVTTTQEVTQDNDNGTNNFIGGDGVIADGEADSKDNNH